MNQNTLAYERIRESYAGLFEEDLLSEICQEGTLKTYEAERVIIDIGSLVTHMPLVLSGSIKIMTEDEEGSELLLYYLERGETCAVTLNCCTRQASSTVKAITETETELLMVPVEKMDQWMVKYKSWRSFVLDSYNERLSEMVSAIDLIVFKSLEDRLRIYLKDKAWMAKSADISVSHQAIANDLHASRVAVSRLMKKLEKDGYIVQQRNKVTLTQFLEN